MIFEVHCVCILSCFNLGVGAWLIIQLVFLAFQLSSPIFYIMFRMQLGLPHPFITNILWCVCTHPVDPMGIHFLHCVHGNERMGTHEVVCDTFAAIAWDASFHVGRKQSYALFSTTFNSFHRQVNIIHIKDGIRTLANSMQVDLLPRSCTTQGFIAFDMAQAKKKNYCD
jgi:hypothetical protein